MSKYSEENISRIGNAFRKHECNNSDYVIDFTEAMLPCAAEYYREATLCQI